MKILQELREKVREASRSDLRKFGFIFAALLFLLFFLFFPWLFSRERNAVFLFVSLLLAFMAWLFPRSLRPVYFIATLVGLVLGAINNRIILSLIYFIIFTPLAIVTRALRSEDSMHRKYDKKAPTYKIVVGARDFAKNKEKGF